MKIKKFEADSPIKAIELYENWCNENNILSTDSIALNRVDTKYILTVKVK